MGTAGKERRFVSLRRKRKRMAISGGECSGFGEPRWWWRLETQVKALTQVRNTNLESV